MACRDLLKQMLQAEPSKRITIAGIMNHPWFLKDLPGGTHEMNARLQATDNVRCAVLSLPLRFSLSSSRLLCFTLGTVPYRTGELHLVSEVFVCTRCCCRSARMCGNHAESALYNLVQRRPLRAVHTGDFGHGQPLQ